MHKKVIYETLARLNIERPVDRLDYITMACVNKRVLDVGCFDETALVKRDTDAWLHGRIAAVAQQVVGVDNSTSIPVEGIITGPTSKIFHADAQSLGKFATEEIDVVVAGEFIEHINDPVNFLQNLRKDFAGKQVILSTPNGVCFANTLLGLISREAQHPDHLHVFTFKILHTLCERAELRSYKIIPYRFFATEMILRSSGSTRVAAKLAEQAIRLVEQTFPLLSFGYVIDATL